MQGFFDDKNKEYIIKDMKPRRPWLNYLWNENVVCMSDQFGNGFSRMAIGTQRRDIEKGVRNVYIRDRTTGEAYSATRNYGDLPFDVHETHVGINYQRVISGYNGLEVLPCLPAEWDGVTVKRIFRGETYEITYERSDIKQLICDGKPVKKLPLTGKGSLHNVICKF